MKKSYLFNNIFLILLFFSFAVIGFAIIGCGDDDDNDNDGDNDNSPQVWTQKNSGATERGCHTAVEINGIMYVFGGHGADTSDRLTQSLNDLWEYDIAGNSWNEINTLKKTGIWGNITIVGNLPTPGPDARGLTWDGTYLWITDWSNDKIYQVDGDGNIQKNITSPGSFPTGLTWDGTYLWNADDSTDTIYKINPLSGSIVTSFIAPAGFPSGLAWDGTYLWHVDTGQGKIYKLNPGSGAVIASFSTPDGGGSTSCAGLTFDDTYLIYTHGLPSGPNKSYKLEPSSGVVFDEVTFDNPPNFPTGTTWDGRYYYVVDSDNDKVYKFLWTSPGDKPKPRVFHIAEVSQGYMGIFGGREKIDGGAYLDDVWIYDIINNTWIEKSPAPIKRGLHTAVMANDKMYVFGGEDGTGEYVNDVWEYDVTNDSWTQKHDGTGIAPVKRSLHSAVIYNDKMYIFGGQTDPDETCLNEIWEYNVITNSWAQKASGATPRKAHSSVIYNGKIYVFGGWDGTESYNDLWIYEIEKDSWKRGTEKPPKRAAHSAIKYKQQMYIFGGAIPEEGTETGYKDNWEYKFE